MLVGHAVFVSPSCTNVVFVFVLNTCDVTLLSVIGLVVVGITPSSVEASKPLTMEPDVSLWESLRASAAAWLFSTFVPFLPLR